MSEENIHLKIEKNKFLILTPLELNSFMSVNEFSEETKIQIKYINGKYNNAFVVLFFLNETIKKNSYSLDCFMPIYKDIEIHDMSSILQDINGIACCPFELSEPIINWNHDEIGAIANKVINKGGWTQDYGFGVQKMGKPIVHIDMLNNTVEKIDNLYWKDFKSYIDRIDSRIPAKEVTTVKKTVIRVPKARRMSRGIVTVQKFTTRKTETKKPLVRVLEPTIPIFQRTTVKKNATNNILSRKPVTKKYYSKKYRYKKTNKSKISDKKGLAVKIVLNKIKRRQRNRIKNME